MLSTTFRYFYEVVRTKSISKAAHRLNISPSAISRQISLLEHELGERLIERLARGIRLTKAGELVGEHLHHSLLAEEVLRSEIAALGKRETGKVQVATVEGAISHLLPNAIEKFSTLYSELEVEIYIAGANTAADMVRDDIAEVGIVFQPDDLSRLKSRVRVAAPFCAILPTSNPLADRDGLSLSELRKVPLVLNDYTFSARNHVERAAKEAGMTIRASIMINSIDGAKAIVASGFGVAFMPRFGAVPEIAAGTLRAIPMKDPILNAASLQIVTREGRHIRGPVKALLDILADIAASIPTN